MTTRTVKVDGLLARSEPSESSEPGARPTVISDWKEIARYLGKGVRTVQRWERELDLPVRRPRKETKGSVIAVVAEIDAWVKVQQFHRGRVAFNESGRVTLLLQSLEELRTENQELRRQLEAERANMAAAQSARRKRERAKK
jgi:hypothetical protein